MVVACVPETSNTKIGIKGPDVGIDFLVDNTSLYEVPENANWRADADLNIETHRKSDVQFA